MTNLPARILGIVVPVILFSCGRTFLLEGEGASGQDLDVDQHVNCVQPNHKKNCSNGWCRVEAGCFKMGDVHPLPSSCGSEKRVPARTGKLTRDFLILQTEVTQADFLKLMGYNPSCHQKNPPKGCIRPAVSEDTPVHYLTWHMAAAYCNQLNGISSKCYDCSGAGVSTRCKTKLEFSAVGGIYRCNGIRLPTEFEWEYSYRSGTSTAFYNGPMTNCIHDTRANEIGWYDGNSRGPIDPVHPYPHPVGAKKENALGLFDMAGNAWEWVHDAFSPVTQDSYEIDFSWEIGDGRFLKGGGWGNPALMLRAGHRPSNGGFPDTYRGATNLGFRCAKTE